MNPVFQRRLDEAKDYLSGAVILYENGMDARLITVKLYYAVLYGVMAHFLIDDMAGRTHDELIRHFETECVGPGKYGDELLDVLRLGYAVTHSCGCPVSGAPEGMPVEKMIAAAKDFLSIISE